jgi:putative endonuclease
MTKSYFVYILASERRGTLYIGVTNDVARRAGEHKERRADGFTKKYGVHRLVHVEGLDDVNAAIAREKAMKKWRRDWKIQLIEERNPKWDDLFPAIAR